MTKLALLREELKELARKIHQAKVDCKECQRAHNGCDGYFEGPADNLKWIGGYFSTIQKLKHEFRHKHIAYCLLRGRTREQIESPAEENKPNETLIQEIIDAYIEKDVCVSAA